MNNYRTAKFDELKFGSRVYINRLHVFTNFHIFNPNRSENFNDLEFLFLQ